MSVGAYCFVTEDWRTRDYPLDLWLSWHLEQFDEVAVIKYGDFPLPVDSPKLRMKSIDLNPMYEQYFKFYTIGKTEAQKLLDTEWKILLDIDEFVYPVSTNNMHPSLAYPLNYHNMYGSLEYEMAPSTAFPQQQFRIHYGDREILGDGANVAGPWSQRGVDVWHTGACRNPDALSVKWRAQIQREIAMDYTVHSDRLKFLDGPFPYGRYREIWQDAKLVKCNMDTIPEILFKNRERFDWWKP